MSRVLLALLAPAEGLAGLWDVDLRATVTVNSDVKGNFVLTQPRNKTRDLTIEASTQSDPERESRHAIPSPTSQLALQRLRATADSRVGRDGATPSLERTAGSDDMVHLTLHRALPRPRAPPHRQKLRYCLRRG